METINGLKLFESDRFVDYFVSEAISGTFVPREERHYDGAINPKFNELINGDIYRNSGNLNVKITINDIEFEAVDLEKMFVRMDESMNNLYKKQYSNLDNEVTKRVEKKIEKFIDEIHSIKDSVLYSDED
jgi:hypothetical protein